MIEKPVPQTAHEIDAAAADWAARADRGLSPDDAQTLEAWLAGDVRRVGAYAKARAVMLYTDRAQALGRTYDPEAFRAANTPARPSRRLVIGGTAAAAVAAAVFGVGMRLKPVVYSTRRGEVRVISLQDGSIITLNTASKVAVSYSNRQRDVKLVEGEALFDVAHDKARPFVVAAGDTHVRAVGTSFTVSHIGATPVQVLVREGVVEVNRAKLAAPVRAAANTRVLAPIQAVSVESAAVPAAEVGRALAWREGRIAFEGETLAQAALQFSRYSDIRIVIADSATANEEITGLFQANDPVGFAQAVATSLDLKTQVGAGEVRISR
jgi:transmembrane sensor